MHSVENYRPKLTFGHGNPAVTGPQAARWPSQSGDVPTLGMWGSGAPDRTGARSLTIGAPGQHAVEHGHRGQVEAAVVGAHAAGPPLVGVAEVLPPAAKLGTRIGHCGGRCARGS